MLWAIYYKLENYKDRFKWAIQRAFRGYDDTDLWNLNTCIADIAIPVLDNMIKNVHGCPVPLFEEHKEEPCEKWIKILKDIKAGFEAYNVLSSFEYFVYKNECNHTLVDKPCDCIDWKATYKKEKELTKIQNKGLKLFAEYFNALWD